MRKGITLVPTEDSLPCEMMLRTEYDEEYNKIVKNIPGIKWNEREKCWYLKLTWPNLSLVFVHLKNKYWINKEQAYAVLREGDKRNRSRKDVVKSERTELPELSAEMKARIGKFREWMDAKRYSVNTTENYIRSLEIYYRFNSPKTPEELANDDLVNFNNNYILANKLSFSYQNTFVNGLKLFLRHQNIRGEQADLERPRRTHHLPNILSIEEVKLLLDKTRNVKHKAMLAIIYECGLRCGELLSLMPADIQRSRLMLHIHMAKGNKDRLVPISPKLLAFLERYWKLFQPKIWLFEGANPGDHYSERSLQQVLKRSLALAGIKKRVTLHTLRHCYATHHLEAGTDIRYIQHLLGHKSPKTTQIYTHVSNDALKRLKSLLDEFEL